MIVNFGAYKAMNNIHQEADRSIIEIIICNKLWFKMKTVL